MVDFRPAYNVRMATAGSPFGGPRTIVGIQVTNVGSDMGAITPMLDEIERRTGELPNKLLADANHAAHDCIRAATAAGVEARRCPRAHEEGRRECRRRTIRRS
jgi:hypothetical protein